MEILNSAVTLLSHMMFIGMTYVVVRDLFDWSKIIKTPSVNLGRLKIFLLFFSIAIGYLVSHFILEVVTMSQTLFFGFQ